MMKKLSLVAALGGIALMVACGGSTPSAAAPDPNAAAGAAGAAAPDPKGSTPAAPSTGDADGDGIPDATDKCPDKKEDGQAPDPKDGCPKA